MLTTMSSLLRVVTSAPATPLASTRCTMMSRAWLSCSVVTLVGADQDRLQDQLRAAVEVEAELGRPLRVTPGGGREEQAVEAEGDGRQR